MVAAKEKTFSPSRQPTFNWSPRGTYVQAAATSNDCKPTTIANAEPVVSRFTQNDFRPHKSKKSPIGSTVKIQFTALIQNHQRPRENTRSNRPQLRQPHLAPEMSQYRGYFVPGAMDPFGLWTKVSANIYEADRCHESLEDLAEKITGDSRDWVCIWPKNWIDPSIYPVASIGDQANVSNLLKTNGKKLSLAPRTNDKLINGIAKGALTNPNSGELRRWTDGKSGAKQIQRLAGKGRTPLSHLTIISQIDGTLQSYASDNDGSKNFVVEDLIDLGGPNDTNTYAEASKRSGPSRCWFCKDAKVVVFSGKTSGIAERYADQILRGNASAFGSTAVLHLNENNTLQFSQDGRDEPLRPFAGETPASNFDEAMKLSQWLEYPAR